MHLSQVASNSSIPLCCHTFYLNLETVLTVFRQLRQGISSKGILRVIFQVNNAAVSCLESTGFTP